MTNVLSEDKSRIGSWTRQENAAERPTLRELGTSASVHGFSLGILLPGVTNLLLGRTSFRFIDVGMTIYFFVRQLGAAIGVAATVALIDIRETLHSSRLFDSANRLSPSVDNAVRRLTLLLHSRNLPSKVATAGAYQLFRGSVVQQTSLLALIDVFWCLALLAVAGILLVLMLQWRDHVAHRRK
jgi:hypothetical protein